MYHRKRDQTDFASPPPSRVLGRLLACLTLGTLLGRAGEPAPAAGIVDFNQSVRPLLADRCLSCHGGKKQESGLRLDSEAAALKGGEHGAPYLPGKANRSLLVEVTAGTHPEIARMPKKGAPLTAAELSLLRAWIDQGAKWPAPSGGVDAAAVAANHWAFHAPTRPALPDSTGHTRALQEVDRFVVARLQKEGLKLAPEAGKTQLLRRLSLDLVGLPPSPQDVQAFLADRSADAWGRQVERLLASPHYGEKWARQWLDAARYADSDGFEKDKPRFVWAYRDWVVGALNRDLPYDRFIIEQIAGDQLPDPTPDQLVATGFLRNAMLNEEGGVDPEQFAHDMYGVMLAFHHASRLLADEKAEARARRSFEGLLDAARTGRSAPTGADSR